MPRTSAVLFLALLAGAPLGAQLVQDSQGGFRAIVSFPQNALKQASSATFGFQAGINVNLSLDETSTVRTTVNYKRYDGGNLHGLTLADTVYAFAAGVDYLYYLEGRRRGAYLIGGVAWDWWKVDDRHTPPTYNQSPSADIGVGVRTKPDLAIEITLSEGSFRPVNGNALAFDLALNFLF
jgi:hypothetical protein